MDDLHTENLIDLSADDNVLAQDTNLLLLDAVAPPPIQPHVCHFIAPMNSNDTDDNNPFDMVQKLATEPGDPFELVEHQARHFPQKNLQVKEGNLLSFSGEGLLDAQQDSGFETPPIPPPSSSTSKEKSKSVEHRKHLLKLSLANSSCQTPTGRNCSPLGMLVDESPLKFVDDDLMSETPPDYASPSLDNDFEKDLRELQIPILKQLPSPSLDTKADEDNMVKQNNDTPTSTSSANLLNLEILRGKLRAKRLQKQEQSSIKGIINSLKSLLCDSDLPDVEKKQRANNLLETLSSCVEDTESKNKQATKEQETPPTPIKRQGTFDLDLKQEEAQTQAQAQPLPEIMISSSGTYDGDNDKHDLDLPEVVLPPLEQTNYQHDQTGISSGFDLNELVDQLSKLLGQQKLSSSADDSSECQHAANPTVIVVMNTSNVNNNLEHENNMSQVQRASQAFRRRSQSLSLIDKVRIVQLPLPEAHAQMSSENEDQYLSPPIPDHMLNMRQNDSVLNESQFKTPARIFRRNSFSSGTPVTHNNSIMGRRVGPEALQKTRRLTTLTDKRPGSSMAKAASSTLRPETRNKMKTESIVKSSGPMKATIPLKKIAPTFKVKQEQLDASMNFLHTSTPMPQLRSDYSLGSPIKRNKPRVSHMPVTPNVKAAAAGAHNDTPINLNRRTFNELRTKSPIKSRIGVIGGINKPGAAGRTNTARTLAGTTTTGSRTLNRLGVPSGIKSFLSTTNKENKRP